MSKIDMEQMNLSKNEFQFPHHQRTRAAVRLDSASIASYSNDTTLADQLAKLNGVAPETVLLYPGGATAISHTILSYAAARSSQPGVVLVPELTWQYYEELGDAYRLPTEQYDVVERGLNISLYSDDLRRKAAKLGGALIIIPTPNNPTGSAMSEVELIDICHVAHPDSTVFVDNCYFGFGSDDLSVSRILRECPNVVFLKSFSKFFGLAGMRIAYLLAGNTARSRLMLKPQYLGFNRAAEQVALACLSERQYYEKQTEALVQQRHRLQRFFNDCEGVTCYNSMANFLFLKFPGFAGAYVDYLKDNGVLARRIDTPKYPDCVRLTIGTPSQMDHVERITKDFLRVSGEASLCKA